MGVGGGPHILDVSLGVSRAGENDGRDASQIDGLGIRPMGMDVVRADSRILISING